MNEFRPNRGDILIVDDQPANLKVLTSILTEQGYQVRPATSGQLALKAARKKTPDLVLLDAHIIDMDSHEFCEHLKADERTHDIPVIFTGVLDEPLDKARAFAAGGADYVTSPFQKEEILARVETHVTLRVTQRQLGEKTVQLEPKVTERVRAEALRQRNYQLAMLNQVSQELSVTLDLRQIVERLLQTSIEMIHAGGASVWLWDEEQEDRLICQSFWHRNHGRYNVDLYLLPGQGIAGWVVETGENAIVSNVSKDPRFFSGVDEQTGFRTTSLLAVPLWVRGKVIGVLETINKDTHKGQLVFDQDDLILVETLAASAAIAIDNARLVNVMRQNAAELAARNEELDAFAHTVAHDLKNPLAHISGFAEVLKNDYTTLSDEDLRRYLYTIARNGRKMSNIIDELLLLAEVRRVKAKMRPLDMAQIVAEAQKNLAYMIEEYHAEITLPPYDTWPAAMGYAPWTEQVWINYLSNAIKYSEQPPRVKLGATEQTNGMVRFWIQDKGPGLTLEEQTRLFTPFTQLGRVRAKGHGLGLSIVRRIVEKMGGQVDVESKPNQGSIFSFTLPSAGE